VVGIIVKVILVELEISDVLEDALQEGLTSVLREVAKVLIEGNDLFIVKVHMGNNEHKCRVLIIRIVILVIELDVVEERDHQRFFFRRERIISSSILQREEHRTIYWFSSRNEIILLATPAINNNAGLILGGEVEAKNNENNRANNNDGNCDTDDNSQNATLVDVD